MRPVPKAVVFDMDGVLVDARDWHFRALNEALAVFGVEIGMEEHMGRFNGLPTKVKLQMLSEEGRLPSHLFAIVETVKQERTLREAARMCFPRVEHLLVMGWLKRQSCKVAVATNSVRATSTTMLKFAGLYESLDALVTNEDVRMAKPSPEIYLEACRRLEVVPSDVVVIEDHPYGVQAAHEAGCSVVQVEGVADVNTALLEQAFHAWARSR